MNLEFFAQDGGGALVLLYGGGPDEVVALRRAVRALAEGSSRRLALHELAFVRSVDACRLTALLGTTDIGMIARPGPGEYEWILASETWLQIDELLEPFEGETSGTTYFQHLNPANGPEVIYSTSRGW